jgi:hypothetical protein
LKIDCKELFMLVILPGALKETLYRMRWLLYVSCGAVGVIIGLVGLHFALKPKTYSLPGRIESASLTRGMSKAEVEARLGSSLAESPTRLRDYTQAGYAASPGHNYVLLFKRGAFQSAHTPDEMRAMNRPR